jgi:hypothetical protein
MNRLAVIGALGALLLAASLPVSSTAAFSQTLPSSRVKTIGVPSSAKQDVVTSLIVVTARSAALENGKLVLGGVAPNSIVFADRPVRAAGHVLTAHLLQEWSGGETFAKDPPNATISALDKDGSSVRDAVIVLKAPKLDGDKLTFDVDVLEGSLTGAEGPASVFIDSISYPFPLFSFGAGVRRNAQPIQWYKGYGAAAAPYEPGASIGGPTDDAPWQQ